MPEIIFPKEWWKMSQEDYQTAKIALKSLLSVKDVDAGIKQV
jgi:hypothetical protein